MSSVTFFNRSFNRRAFPAPRDENCFTQFDLERSWILENLSCQEDKTDQIIYSISFCKHADKLSQWRAYANDATGLCIGFNASLFKQLESCGYALKNINYNELDLVNTAYQNFTTIFNFLNNITLLHPNYTKEELDDIALRRKAILHDIKMEMPFYKAVSFNEEEELRLCFTAEHNIGSVISSDKFWAGIDNSMCEKTEISSFSLSQLKFRISPVGLQSYYELSFEHIKDNLITDVIIGPKCIATIKDIYFFLAANGYHVVSQNSTSVLNTFSQSELSIRKSDITYR